MSGPLHAFVVIEGRRAVLERELMWAVALGGDPVRIEQLGRMLMPSANDHLAVLVDGADVSPTNSRTNANVRSAMSPWSQS